MGQLHLGIPIDDTDFGYTLSIISGKYKLMILYWIYQKETLRYNELKRLLGTIAHKTLSNTLKELEGNGIIIREEFQQIPPKVEYSLSEKGTSLIPLLNCMCNWGSNHRKQG